MIRRTIIVYSSIFFACILFLMGAGLFNAYFPVFASESISSETIGFITSLYYFGFLSGCLAVTRIMDRVGHIRAFAVVCAIVASSALGFTIVPDAAAWIPLRFLMGFGYAGIYVVIESWINSQSADQDRGRVYAIYRIVELSSLSMGQFFMILLKSNTAHFHFSVVTLLTILSIIPFGLTLLPQPKPTQATPFNFKTLWGTSQYSTISMFMVGMANSVIWMMTPLFLLDRSLPVIEIPQIFVFFILGGILAQYPIGRLSDWMDRRTSAILTALCSIVPIVMLQFATETWHLRGCYFLLGAFSMSIYSLVMTHAMDRAQPEKMSKISAQLLFVYSFGAIMGPTISGFMLEQVGQNGYTNYLATVFGVMVLYGVVQRFSRPPVSKKDRKKFRFFPEGSPVIMYYKRIANKK